MTALLKPMPRDALLRKPAAAAAPVQPKPAALVDCDAPETPVLMKPASFAPTPEKHEEPKAEENQLDELLAAFVTDEEDDDEPLEDCVPTSQMPVPVCVPLYEEPRRRRGLFRR